MKNIEKQIKERLELTKFLHEMCREKAERHHEKFYEKFQQYRSMVHGYNDKWNEAFIPLYDGKEEKNNVEKEKERRIKKNRF